MNKERQSLERLQDIILAPEPALWPLSAIGMLVVGIGLVCVMIMGWSLMSRYRERAYRRAAIELLVDVRTVRDVNKLLKRVALVVWPRAIVAPLYGSEWVAFLCKSCPQLKSAAFAYADGEGEASAELLEQAQVWILHHRKVGESV